MRQNDKTMFWRRKKKDEQQQPQINYQFVGQAAPVPQTFKVDAERFNAATAILSGQPFFIVYQSPTEIKTLGSINRAALCAGLTAMAAQNKAFADDLLNVVIDINTQNGTKTPAERKTE